jgi:hypothetical protein
MKRVPEFQVSRAKHSKVGCIEMIQKRTFFARIQTVDALKPKFQLISLCAVDAHTSNLRSGSSLFKDGVHEAQLDL